MNILVIAEHQNNELKPATLHTISAASQLDKNISVLIAGHNCKEVANEIATIENVSKVLLADDAVYRNQLAENLSQLIGKLAENYDYILAPATTFGKNLMPRVAALLDVAQISDVVAIQAADTFVRPIYAGNALATVQSNDKVKIITVRSTAFNAAIKSSSTAPIETISIINENKLTTFIDHELSPSIRPELTSARVIVSGGRGMQNSANFKLLDELADELNAAIGASRAAVDAGFVPNDYQIGQTGKIVAPELYIAIGISGAIQHIAGIKDSKIIVAINKDPDAPIFQIADYGLIGDLFTILPELTEALRNK